MSILVSVIIPTYKGSNKLSRAIDSVLNQTYKDIEIVIVDDNGVNTIDSNKTELVINKYNDNRIKYIKHKVNLNGANARNTGIENCTGEYITFLDDDDFMLPKRIEKMLKLLLKNNEYQAIYSNVILANNTKIIGTVIADKILTEKDILLNEMSIGTGSNIFISRKILNKVSKFDENFTRHQDLEFMIRVCEYTNVLNINEFLVVKATNGADNSPSYKNMKNIKSIYYEKFKSNIKKLNEDEISKFYIKNTESLYIAAILSNNFKYVEEAKLELKKYKKLNIKEHFIYLIVKLRLLKIFMLIKNTLNKVRPSIRKLSINSYEIEFIKEKL